MKKDFERTQQIKDHLAHQGNELRVIQEFENLCKKEGRVELFVKWKCFTPYENDWVPIESLRKEVPEM